MQDDLLKAYLAVKGTGDFEVFSADEGADGFWMEGHIGDLLICWER